MILLRMVGEGLTSTVRAWRAILVLALVSMLCALPVSMVLSRQWDRAVQSSLFSEGLMSGFDFTVITDVFQRNPGLTQGVASSMLAMLLLHAIAVALVGGGIIRAAADSEMTKSFRTILRLGGEYAGRLLRLMMVEAVLIVVATGIVFIAAAIVVQGLTQTAQEETSVITALYGFGGLMVIVLYFLAAWGDYGRLHLVMSDDRSALKSYLHGAAFHLKHVLPAASMHIILGGGALLLLWLHWIIDDHIAVDTGMMILATLLLFELFFVIRTALRILNYASAAVLWKYVRRDTETRPSSDVLRQELPTAEPHFVQLVQSEPRQDAEASTMRRRTLPVRRSAKKLQRKPRPRGRKRS